MMTASPKARDVKPEGWTENDPAVMPLPAEAPATDHGKPDGLRAYFAADGGTLFYQCRFYRRNRDGEFIYKANGKRDKADRYHVLLRAPSGALYWSWSWAAIPRPRPLYGYKLLADRPTAPVMVHEGEKAADTAAELAPDYVHVSWMGGSSSAPHADWPALVGRDVTVWRDNDQPGLKAARAIAEALAGIAHGVRLVQLETISKHVQHDLKQGFDISDLKEEEGWNAESMLRLLADPAFASEPATVEEPSAHKALIESLETHLSNAGITQNAAEQWCDVNYVPIPRVTTGSIARTFAFTYRSRCNVATDRVCETLAELGARRSDDRRVDLILSLTGRASTDAGRGELVRYLRAVTGCDDPTALGGLKHWIWLVKRTMAGYPRQHDIMPVYFGRQDGGKSTAVAKLCGPLMELVLPIRAVTLTDERSTATLGRAYVGVWDEMEGATKADVEAIKNAITCTTQAYREMKTNGSSTVVRTMNFIGTSNKPIGHVIRDTTGLRRFLQIECSTQLDWATINDIDYHLLWQCVSENDPPPLVGVKEDLVKRQEQQRHRDSVSLWVEQETWGRLRWEPVLGAGPVVVAEYNADAGELAEELRSRYLFWCRTTGEPACLGNAFFQRLTEEGFTTWRPRLDGKRGIRRYRRPAARQEALDVG